LKHVELHDDDDDEEEEEDGTNGKWHGTKSISMDTKKGATYRLS
jgi:hypothetical protein